MIIPQVAIVILKQDIGDFVVLDIVKIFYEVTFMMDACIYIIIHPAVRRLLFKKLHLYKQKSDRPKLRVVRLDQPTIGGRSAFYMPEDSTHIGGTIGAEPTYVTKQTYLQNVIEEDMLSAAQV